MVVLTDDIHSSSVTNLLRIHLTLGLISRTWRRMVGGGVRNVESHLPGKAGSGSAKWSAAADLAKSLHIKNINLCRCGYMLLDIDPDWAQAGWYHLITVLRPSLAGLLAAVFMTIRHTSG